MIEGEKTGLFDADGDVINAEIGLGVEVKARDNKHPFEIRVGQRNEFAHGSRLTYLAYCLWCYKSWRRYGKAQARPSGSSEKTTTYSLLKECRTEEEQFRLLSEKTDRVFLLDIQVIDALGHLNGVVSGGPPGRERESHFRIWRTNLYQFVGSIKERDLLGSLTLDPEDWVIDEYRMRVTHWLGNKRYSLSFDLVTVLKHGLNALITPILEKRAIGRDGLPF